MPPDFLPTHHRSLRLQNFTAFADASFEFVPGVNVLVGENGTGKTHVLKALYMASRYGRESERLHSSQPVYGVHWWGLIRHQQPAARLNGRVGESDWYVRYEEESAGASSPPLESAEPVFLPAIDMIGHSKGYLALEREYRIDFDQTYSDIVSKLEPTTKNQPNQIAAAQMQTLQDRMGGTVEYDQGDRRFYLVTPQGRIAMPLVAEGLRKFATLHTIWKNGWLRPGTCLFWDEPEANLNPSLMDEAVAAILALARGGVQVFLATHSYVILKELEVQTTGDDSVRFFALEKTDGGTIVHPADRYLDLKPNLIEEQYLRLYDLTLQRAIRGSRR